MAVIEIQAATLPGFPYYFPYRTGVRLSNAATVDGSKVYYGDTSVTLTAEATVTSLREVYAEGDLALTGNTTPESLRTALVDASQSALFAVALDFLRDSSLSATETITAVRNAVVSRGQQLEALLDLTTWFDTLANYTAAPTVIDPVIEVGITADIQLNAVGDTTLALVSSTSAASRLDAVGATDTTVTTGFNFDGDSGIGLEVGTTEVSVGIAAEALRSVEMAAETIAVTAEVTGQASREQYLEAITAISAALAAKVTNADVSLAVSAALDAEIALTRYLDAELATTATALVDILDTRYADAAVTVSAEISAEATLAAYGSAELASTVQLDADSLRTALVDTDLGVLATTPVIISHEQPFQASLELAVQHPAEIQADFAIQGDLAITGTEEAMAYRIAVAAAQIDLTAEPTTTALRTAYVDAAVEVTAHLIPFPFASLGAFINPIPYQVTAAPSGFLRGEYVGNSRLDLLGSSYPMPNAYFLVAAVLRAMADPDSAGVLSMKIDAQLDTTAVIDLISIHRAVWAAAQDIQILATLQEYRMQFIWLVQAELDLVASCPAAMLYRHSGGNPMWLMFFYGGEGRRYPVAGSGSPG